MASAEILKHVRYRRKNSIQAASYPHLYEINRGLEEYQLILPRFQERNAIYHAMQKAESGPISLLDIGCGSGTFLGELSARIPNSNLYGVSGYDYRSQIVNKCTRQRVIQNVDYRVGDAQRLHTVFPDTNFDIIVSSFCFQYLGDPLNALKTAYRKLNKDGILFVHSSALEVLFGQFDLLEEAWQSLGIEANIEQRPLGRSRGIAIKKGDVPNLHLPLIKFDPIVTYRYAPPQFVPTP